MQRSLRGSANYGEEAGGERGVGGREGGQPVFELGWGEIVGIEISAKRLALRDAGEKGAMSVEIGQGTLINREEPEAGIGRSTPEP